MSLAQEFIEFAIAKNVLQFGEFITKAGRKSPYFFNMGLFADGDSLQKLGEFYARMILMNQISFDILLGLAYKGIPLVTTTAVALNRLGHNFPYAYNRKEIKGHGEGGMLVGAPLRGNVLVLDDVISAGTSVRLAMSLIHQEKAVFAGICVALDRQEKGVAELSAVQELRGQGLTIESIATLDDLLNYLQESHKFPSFHREAILAYKQQWGVKGLAK